MKSIFIYLLVFIGFLIPTGLTDLSAADYQGLNSPDEQHRTDLKKRQGEGREGEGGSGGEGEEDREKADKKEKQKIQQEKARLAKAEEGSFGMLKDLFQSTFDYFYAPDSTKSEGITLQKE